MRTGKEKATAGTVAQVKAQAQTQTLADIIAEVAPIVKRQWPNLNGRLTRAIEIASTPNHVIAAMTPNTWWVRSQRPGQGNEREWYKVKALESCECADARYNGSLCKHLVAVELTKLAKAGGNGSAPRPREWECNCVLPSQSCPTCEAAARAVYGDEWEVL